MFYYISELLGLDVPAPNQEIKKSTVWMPFGIPRVWMSIGIPQVWIPFGVPRLQSTLTEEGLL